MSSGMSAVLTILLGVTLIAYSEAFFMRWSSDNSQSTVPKAWIQPLPPNLVSAYRYSYPYMPYDQRKVYQMPQQYAPEMHQMAMSPMQQNLAPIPISIPAGANLTPVSLQHVQLVPCMCPVAPDEAEKLQESVGPGPYLAQSYQPTSYQSASQPPSEAPGVQPKQ